FASIPEAAKASAAPTTCVGARRTVWVGVGRAAKTSRRSVAPTAACATPRRVIANEVSLMAYSQYSEHRRPNAVPKVQKVERSDTTGAQDLKLQKGFAKAAEQAAPKPAAKRAFAALLKAPKK